MIELTDLEFAGVLFVAIMAVLGLDMVVAKRSERRWAQRRQQLRIRSEIERNHPAVHGD